MQKFPLFYTFSFLTVRAGQLCGIWTIAGITQINLMWVTDARLLASNRGSTLSLDQHTGKSASSFS
jgi:hypothetical protein